jgi:hypothetical protein
MPSKFVINTISMIRTYTFPKVSEIKRVPSIVNLPSAVVDRVGNLEIDCVQAAKDTRSLRVDLVTKLTQRSASQSASSLDAPNINNTTLVREVVWKPKPRYDIDIVTKIIVYAGVGWGTMEGIPLLFIALGLA